MIRISTYQKNISIFSITPNKEQLILFIAFKPSIFGFLVGVKDLVSSTSLLGFIFYKGRFYQTRTKGYQILLNFAYHTFTYKKEIKNV